MKAGDIILFGGTALPAGYLFCDGSAVSRTSYANLFAAIGTAWGAGDGSTTFNIPDMRGYFARGWNHSSGNDPDSATRTGGDAVGSSQTSAQQRVYGAYSVNYSPLSGGSGSFTTSSSTSRQTSTNNSATLNSTCSVNASSQIRTAASVQVRNKAVNHIIKF
jgi:microcystin-dependent protein